jgi:hypothetical protein
MKCKLCQEEKKLIKAHIIPKFIYKRLGLYSPDEKGQGRVHKAIYNKTSIKYNPKGYPDGLYDKNILCEDCDNYINEQFETYGKKILFPETPIPISEISFHTEVDEQGTKIGIFSGIKYTEFKLFIISIFWRASISSLVHGIKLTDGEEEQIRLMLVNKDGKEDDYFGTIIFQLDVSDEYSQIMTGFKSDKNGDFISYSFIAGKFVFRFYLQKSGVPESLKPFIISSSNKLKIIVYPHKQSVDFFNAFLGRDFLKY